jgi:hypothetical protein
VFRECGERGNGVCGESGSLTRVTGRLFRPEGVRPKGRGAVSICGSAAGRENPHRPAADVRLTTPPCSGSNSHPAVPDDDSSSQRRPTATAANSDRTIPATPSATTAPAARPGRTSTRLTKCAAPAITTPASTDQSSRRYPAQLAAGHFTVPQRSQMRRTPTDGPPRRCGASLGAPRRAEPLRPRSPRPARSRARRTTRPSDRRSSSAPSAPARPAPSPGGRPCRRASGRR